MGPLSNYLEIPYLNETDQPMDDDQVIDLHILQAMAKPSYIIACYCTIKSRDSSIMKEIPWRTSWRTSFRSYRWRGCQDRIAKDHEQDNPMDSEFDTFVNCRLHYECNDPIFHCFALARTSTDLAKSRPSYRDQFKEIASQAQTFSLELLSLCSSTMEVLY